MFGLSFLSPLFLVGAVAAAIPVVLHLMRRRTDVVVEFPAVRLLQLSPVEQRRRRRLRELLLLALRVTALVLLALAFARPYVAGSAAVLPTPTTVVAIDVSLSLSAPGQFDLARAAARQVVADAPSQHRVALVTFADSASVAVPATTDRGGVLAAIDALTPTAGGTRFRTALARAAEAVADGGGRIVAITDLQQAGWESADEGAVPDGIPVEVVAVKPPAGNLALTAVRREGGSIIAGVHNFGTRSARAAVRLRLQNRDAAVETVEIAPQAAAEVRLSAALPAAGGAEVRVDDAEGYQGDNARYLVLDASGAVPIVLVTGAPPTASNAGIYVERALSIAGEQQAFDVTVVDGRSFAGRFDAARTGALILLGTTTLDRQGRERVAGFVRDGGRALVTLGPDIDLATLADVVGVDVPVDVSSPEQAQTVTLVASDLRHPIFRPFLGPSGALGDVTIERYRHLRETRDAVVLARFSGAGIAMTEQVVGRGRLLLFASDLDNRWNRFPLNPAFVPWAIETARYLTQGRVRPQAFTLPDVPPGVRPTPGVHVIQAPAAADGSVAPSARVAVNPDVRESNPARTSVEEFTTAIARLHQVEVVRAAEAARDQEERQRLWQLGLALLFLALAGEGLIGRRAV
jgi:hypothetical protein